jgi:hypothetical protein
VRRDALTKVILASALLLMVGCEILRPNEGRFVATVWAAYAGRFRIAYGHWPTIAELEEFSCMRGRADRFGLELSSCDDVVNSPYRPRLMPHGLNLEMHFINAAGKPVCRLTVIAPAASADQDVFPMIVIKTTVLACPGRVSLAARSRKPPA